MEFLKFVMGLAPALLDLLSYVKKGQPDPEEEHRLALAIIRKASDDQMRRELGL